jgi:Zn-dependent M28 family amino/carboxypeptidase
MRKSISELWLTALSAAALSMACGNGGTTTGTGGTGATGGATSSGGTSSGGATGGSGGGTTGTGGDDAAAAEQALKATLADLAAIGIKRSGTEGGQKAGDYVKKRFDDLGIKDVSFESYSFLAFDLGAHSLAVTVNGASVDMKHDVFAYSGAGHVDADIIDVGLGHEADYMGKDVTGKVVLVTRDPTFHRQAQYQLVAQHGGAAMLYVSTSPNNLIQIGTVADPEDGLAKVPTVTIGADDGKKIKDGLAAGQAAHAVIDVAASVTPQTGRNVVARIPGSDPSGAYVVIGAHYDTWFIGSTDNSTGVASLLLLADHLSKGPQRKLGVVLVGYDGEELGLFGGYDYLRKHVIQKNEPMLAFINLEMPGAGAKGTGLRAVAHTNGGPIDPAAKDAKLPELYTTYVGMELVPAQFGGLIPTDIQGMYWYGLQGLTTYCETPYYHTPEDTPDKVDTAFLASAALRLDDLVTSLDSQPIASFNMLDAKLWNPDVMQTKQPNGDLLVQVTAKDATGAPQDKASVRVWLDVDDFTRAFDLTEISGADGKVQVTVPALALGMGKGARYLYVTAGKTYPLSERIYSL